MDIGNSRITSVGLQKGWLVVFVCVAASACSSESNSKINVGSGGAGGVGSLAGSGGKGLALGGAGGHVVMGGNVAGQAVMGGTPTVGGSPTAGATSWGTGGIGGNGSLGGFGCPTEPSACNDGIDNDGDGKIDAADTECVGPCDNDEGTFATGISGDNVDACKQDCFFDGNSGQGDDGCDWNLKCDSQNPGGHLAKACPYDSKFKNCPATQSAACIETCQRLTPNGCDCFGCCAVPFQGATVNVLLSPACSESSFGDPTKCPRCTQSTSCNNTCGKCEICVGKPAPDPSCILPPVGQGADAGSTTGADSGTTLPPPEDSPCPPGVIYCGNGGQCSSGLYCQTGCCTAWIR